MAGQRPQCTRRLRGGLDVGDPRRVQGDGGRQHDEVGDDVGIEHAAPGVPADAPQLRGRR